MLQQNEQMLFSLPLPITYTVYECPYGQVLWSEITNVTRHDKRPINLKPDAVFPSYCTEQKVIRPAQMVQVVSVL